LGFECEGARGFDIECRGCGGVFGTGVGESIRSAYRGGLSVMCNLRVGVPLTVNDDVGSEIVSQEQDLEKRINT
jgi:hypothetical protein